MQTTAIETLRGIRLCKRKRNKKIGTSTDVKKYYKVTQTIQPWKILDQAQDQFLNSKYEVGDNSFNCIFTQEQDIHISIHFKSELMKIYNDYVFLPVSFCTLAKTFIPWVQKQMLRHNIFPLIGAIVKKWLLHNKQPTLLECSQK